MENLKNKNYLFKNVSALKGVGKKLTLYLKNKKIEKINDLIWNFPYSYTDRSNLVAINDIEIGKIATIKVKVLKYNFPRIRNLPSKVFCSDETGKIEIIFFNSREGYIRKVLPLNEWVLLSGKINYYKNSYQITNPAYITTVDNIDYIKKKISKYSLTEGLSEKSYRGIIEQVLNNLPDLKEWYDANTLKRYGFHSWKNSIVNLHNAKNKDIQNNIFYKRLVLDEIISNLIVLSENRKKLKKIKKFNKIFTNKISKTIIENLDFKLTNNQKSVINEINADLKSKSRMFRILQGDVGSGKTIVSFITSANTLEAGFQSALMAPTEILAKQHYNLAKKIFFKTKVNIGYLSSKTDNKTRKIILNKISSGEIDMLIGTHSIFQKKIVFKKLGYIIIDEQHKFGVRQRMKLAEKGGSNCDVLLMSATPIPRTMMLTIYGDMDVSKITEKPKNRLPILTYSKPEKKILELIQIIKKQIKKGNQVFWVCPLINDSKHLNYSSVNTRYNWLKKAFPKDTAILHGEIKVEDKNIILNKFLKKEIKILVSTTVIEVGIDFPNANLIIIENANKFGLAQLHQLRGRVGRGSTQGICILLFKENLSKNSIQRIKILKKSNDGFFISEEDMKLRGFGDMTGFQQSGEKFFKLADPLIHKDLFLFAEKYIKEIEDGDLSKFDYLLKLFDKADIIN